MYHLIATTTITRLSKHQSAPRAPQIIASGSFQECYQRAMEIGAGRTLPGPQLLLNEVAAFWTDTWTYHIVADRTMDDSTGIEEAM